MTPPKPAREPQLGQFAAQLNDAMEKKKMSIRDLAEAIDSTYEHVRKIVGGLAFPSKYMMRVICKEVDLNPADMERLLNQDKVQHKFGSVVLEMAGIHPRWEELKADILPLNDAQFANLKNIVKGLKQAQRAQERSSER